MNTPAQHKERQPISLNADLGEGSAYDAAMLSIVNAANIACGGHTGDATSMRLAIMLAKDHGVLIGAHPSFPDREHFGRQTMQMPRDLLLASLVQQVSNLKRIADELGAALHHIKPHGALYNQAANDRELGNVLIDLVCTVDPQLALVCLAGSPLVAQARAAGLHVIEEAFADRRYRRDGSLVPRGETGAVIEAKEEAIAQSMHILQRASVISIDGHSVPLIADTLCVHGDGQHALELLQALRAAFVSQGFNIEASITQQQV